MAKRTLSVERLKEIQRYIGEGLSDRQIAKALKCRRTRVAELRSLGGDALPSPPMAEAAPGWAGSVVWPSVLEEIGRGFELKRIWEERAASVTSYSNFWKYLNRRYAWLLNQTVTLREFEAGTHCEVDWAGDTVPWWDERGGEHEAHVFVGILCFSQLIFAYAFENETKPHWLSAHEKMYAFFKGVPRVTVPDNPAVAVNRAHLYDPDLNPAYAELASHYGTAVVPARVRHPKDKALVENAVGILMRLFRWLNRNRRFHSLYEINQALQEAVHRLDTKLHTRLKVSRWDRFDQLEKSHLKPLPDTSYELIEWKVARVHPDSTIAVESACYSVPHVHRGQEVRVKLTAHQVEVFVNLERVALHRRNRSKNGARVIDAAHLPLNALAYREATPQNLLSQARFLSEPLWQFIDKLFEQETLGNIRRVQGIIRHARAEILKYGREDAEPRIAEAAATLVRLGQARTQLFADRLCALRTRRLQQDQGREIQRKPGNPMLRGQNAGALPRQVQPTLLLQERNDHGNDPSQNAHAGVETLRYGKSV